MPERTVRQGSDTYVSQASRSRNNNGIRYALVKNETAAHAYMLIHRKPPLPVTAGTSVVSARLVFHVKWGSHATMDFALTGLASSLRPSKVTWNNQPKVKQNSMLEIPATATGTDMNQAQNGVNVVVEFDVTDHMQAVANGVLFYGWRLECTTANRSCIMFTAEAGLEWRRPRLVIEYAEAPAAPTDLSPSGGRRVSDELPMLSYTYQDFSGNRNQAAQHVQVQEATDVGEPTPGTVWSSGEVPTTEPAFDLAASDCPPLSNNEIRRWRVRAQDGAGLWSGWSDWSWWQRRTQGALTLNNPPSGDGSFVQDTTPPITWTHGGTYEQTHFQVFIGQKNEDGFWENIYNSGVIEGNDDSFTLPRGVLRYVNWQRGETGRFKVEYRVQLRTWDGQNRQSTPGAPAYRRAVQEFLVREGTTAPVENLQVEQANNSFPWAKLTFTRDTAPDAFIIRRGPHVIDRVTPDELDRHPGTNQYTYIDRRATLNRAHTWSVIPVVNHVMSNDEAGRITETVKSNGIWLVNPGRHAAASGVYIVGMPEASLDMTMEDQGENFEVIGRTNPIRVTNALGGAKGSVSGIVTSQPNMPALDALGWRDRLRSFKANEGSRLVLITMDYAMPIIAYNISDSPSPLHDVIDVSFDFVQDNEPTYVGEV